MTERKEIPEHLLSKMWVRSQEMTAAELCATVLFEWDDLPYEGEIVLMPFGYYNVERSRYLKESIHGMSLVKAAWTNGYYALVCNSAEGRDANEWEPDGRKFPGWVGVISPWGRIISFVDRAGNDEALVVETISPEELCDRRQHPNFLARELRPELYQFAI